MGIPQVRIHGVDDVRIDSIDMPEIGPRDVMVEVSLCGICGSDLGYIAMGGLGLHHPMPLGHELVGRISEAGAEVSHVSAGDRVVINPMAAENSIGNGGPEGAFTPYLPVRNASLDTQSVLKIPERFTDQQAAMVEPLSVALHACHQGETKADDKAVIFGAGPIGLCTLLCLQYLGLQQIIVVDQSDYRLEVAQQAGAIPFKAGDGNLAEFLSAQHGEASLMGMPVPATDLYLEATGAKPVFEHIVNTAKTGARVVVLGLHKAPVTMDLANLLLRELRITGSMAYPDEFPQVLEMLASGRVDITPLVSHQLPLSRFDEALQQARDTERAIKVLVDCQA